MANAPVQIAPNGSGGYTLLIDGIDLSHHVKGLSFSFSINADDGLTPQLSLCMTRAINVTAEADAEIVIPDELAAVLARLGWIPPAAETATTEGK